MKRHEYRDMNFWKTLDDKDFAVISGINSQAMELLIEKLRGQRTLEIYAYECDIAVSTLYRTYNRQRKKPLQYEQLLSLYEHRDTDCAVGFEHLLAANGMMLVEDIEKAQKKILQKSGIHVEDDVHEKDIQREKEQRRACTELRKLIRQMKGNRDYARYAFDCRMSKHTISYISTRLRKTPLTDSQLKTLYDNRFPGCSVTMEQLKKANNLFPATSRNKKEMEIETALAVIEPEEKTVKKIDPDEITYDVFLHDMAFYLLKKPKEVSPGIRVQCKQLFKDEKLRKLLHKFTLASEYSWNMRVTQMRDFFEDKGILTQVDQKEPDRLEKKLDKILLK